MAMTPSQLSIIVKSQGIEKAAQDLDKLAKAAASVDSETKAFVIAQSKLAESPLTALIPQLDWQKCGRESRSQ